MIILKRLAVTHFVEFTRLEKYMKENKIKIIILIILVVFIIGLSIINMLIRQSNNKKIFETSIKEIGEQFYSKYIYINQYNLISQSIDEDKLLEVSVEEMLSVFNNIDIKELEKTEFYSKCDLKKSTLNYKAYKPLTEDNFELDVNLYCK